ncbi:uncharacterized protein PG986_008771 [Apiospora aurea]|uniref:AB hydrolase-1 domain-containing protein n=1 Tax=Apiospora aurea TaxID=335848 RepID=A0ABR1Q5T4_9PEZI
MSPRPAFLFVPGAWHRTWTYDPVRADLAARGFPSAAAELASVGAQDPASTGLAQDIAAIRAGLEGLLDAETETEAEVVVVAHSYGGIPAAGAVQGLSCAERAREAVAHGESRSGHPVAHAQGDGGQVRLRAVGRRGGFEMGYIFAEEDQAIPLVAQKAFQSQFPADSFTASFKASHSPFLSMPEALGGVLEQAAEFALKKRGHVE